MRTTILLSITALLAAGTLTACSGGSNGYGSAGSAAASTARAPSSAASGSPAAGYAAPSGTAAASGSQTTDLSTAQSSLGTIVVDGSGMTAYYFTKDVKGSGVSACTGGCATAWPPIETSSGTPTVAGVTGSVGTIPAADGRKQITIDGMPIYTFASDSSAGDVNGQGSGGVWWVIAPDGTMIGG